MGGVFLVGAILLSLLICGNLYNISTIGFVFILISYFGLGFVDDYLKVLKRIQMG